jgi:hypothetical protein
MLAVGVLHSSRSQIKVLNHDFHVATLMALMKQHVQSEVASAIDLESGGVDMDWSVGIQGHGSIARVVLKNEVRTYVWWEIVSVKVVGA